MKSTANRIAGCLAAIVSETDLRKALRATQQYLANTKENVIEMAASKVFPNPIGKTMGFCLLGREHGQNEIKHGQDGRWGFVSC
jgi:hypothetical protein